MLVLPMASARVLSESEIQNLKSMVESKNTEILKAKNIGITNEWAWANVTFREEVKIKTPNYYKKLDYSNGILREYDLCYKDKWTATLSNNVVMKTNFAWMYTLYRDFFGWFGMPDICAIRINEYSLNNFLISRSLQRIPGYTGGPEGDLSITFEEESLNGKDVIKVNASTGPGNTMVPCYLIYYDKNTLLAIKETRFTPGCKAVQEEHTYSYDLSNEIPITEFDFFLPEGAKLCEDKMKERC